MRINEGGVFAPGGYVAADPVGFKEHYHGTQDIPPEHRVFAYCPLFSIFIMVRESRSTNSAT